MKTNREIFMDKLNDSNMDDFIDLINSCGQCGRCSNSYWDGDKTSCHKNINRSSCEKGQKEYFESYPGENLQEKYGKEYWYCDDHEQAQLLNELTETIYSCGVVKWNGVDRCEICYNKGHKCYLMQSKCFSPFQYLMDLHSDYVKEKTRDLHNFDKLIFSERMTFNIWIKDVIISAISDKDIQDKAKHLWELAYAQSIDK